MTAIINFIEPARRSVSGLVNSRNSKPETIVGGISTKTASTTTTLCRVHLTTNAWLDFGPNAVAAIDKGHYQFADTAADYAVNPGDKVSVLEV